MADEAIYNDPRGPRDMPKEEWGAMWTMASTRSVRAAFLISLRSGFTAALDSVVVGAPPVGPPEQPANSARIKNKIARFRILKKFPPAPNPPTLRPRIPPTR